MINRIYDIIVGWLHSSCSSIQSIFFLFLLLPLLLMLLSNFGICVSGTFVRKVCDVGKIEGKKIRSVVGRANSQAHNIFVSIVPHWMWRHSGRYIVHRTNWGRRRRRRFGGCLVVVIIFTDWQCLGITLKPIYGNYVYHLAEDFHALKYTRVESSVVHTCIKNHAKSHDLLTFSPWGFGWWFLPVTNCIRPHNLYRTFSSDQIL